MTDLKGKKMLTEYTGRQQNGEGELRSDSFLILRNTWAQPETPGQGKAGFAVGAQVTKKSNRSSIPKDIKSQGLGRAWHGLGLPTLGEPAQTRSHTLLPAPPF